MSTFASTFQVISCALKLIIQLIFVDVLSLSYNHFILSFASAFCQFTSTHAVKFTVISHFSIPMIVLEILSITFACVSFKTFSGDKFFFIQQPVVNKRELIDNQTNKIFFILSYFIK